MDTDLILQRLGEGVTEYSHQTEDAWLAVHLIMRREMKNARKVDNAVELVVRRWRKDDGSVWCQLFEANTNLECGAPHNLEWMCPPVCP